MLRYIKALKNPKAFFKRYHSIFIITAVLFWIKTYLVYLTQFKLGVEGFYQHFLLFINPVSSTLLIISFVYLFKKKGQYRMLFLVDLISSIWLFANVMYYRFFSDFITIPTIMSAQENSGSSVLELLRVTDILMFIDPIVILIVIVKKAAPLYVNNHLAAFRRTLIAAICVFLINLGLAEIDRPQLLTRTFDRNYLVKYLGVYNFSIYDAIQSTKSMTQRAMAGSDDLVAVDNYIKANYVKPNPDYFGKAQGKNVILISLESLQNFVIDYKIGNQEVTPFLNSLAHDGTTFYFDNFFHQTGQGKTSDAEFMMDTALFPMAQGSVYVNKAQNTEQALSGILKYQGYNSAVFHGNYKTFWNRNEMYRSMGYDKFFDAAYYDMTDENKKNYGMKDIPFFKESVPIMKKLEQPFFAKMITLSNHYPFGMDQQDTTFPVGDFGDKVVNQYFQSANYLDTSLKLFFDDLKASGLYENSIIVMYGDHYGISENYNDAMAKVLNKEEITPFDTAQLQRTVFMVHAPGVTGGPNHTYCGEVDVRPTILHLLGIDTKDYLELGSDILSPEHQGIVPFRNASFVTPQYTYTGEIFYDNATGLEAETPVDADKLIETVKEKLNASDQIVTKDLLRFYTPPNFTPIDRNDYQYLKPTKVDLDYYKSP